MPAIGEPFVILSKIADIEIDAVLQQDTRFDMRVTRNPVEDGTLYTDHMVTIPVVLQIEGRISDTSLNYLTPVKPGRANDAFNSLVALEVEKQPFTVVLGDDVYENMVFESLSKPRTSADGYSVRFNAVLTELFIVGNESLNNRELIAEDVQHTALDEDNAGFVQKVAQ